MSSRSLDRTDTARPPCCGGPAEGSEPRGIPSSAPETGDFPVILAVRSAGRELALDAGETMAAYVTGHLLRSLLETAAGAEAAGLQSDHAAACLLRLCREVCDELCGGGAGRAELN